MTTTISANTLSLSRRSFLRVSTNAAAGLLVSLYLDFPLFAQEGAKPPAKVYPPDAFVHIKPDGKILITVNRLEFGQGVQSSLPMVLADELDGRRSLLHLLPLPMFTKIRSSAFRWLAVPDQSRTRISSIANWAPASAPCSSQPQPDNGTLPLSSAVLKPAWFMAREGNQPLMLSLPKPRRRSQSPQKRSSKIHPSFVS